MGDDPDQNKSSLKHEWNLLWKSSTKDLPEIDESYDSSKVLEVLSADEIKKLTKNLSLNRKTLHQQLEQVQKNIKVYEDKLESAKLVNGEVDQIEDKLNNLIESAQSLVESISRADERIRFFQKNSTN